MCGGGNDNPTPPPVPPAQPLPAAAPLPMPSDVNPQLSASQRRNQISALKFGVMSTLKTPGGAQGTTGAGPDTVAPAAGKKTTIGS